MALKQCVELELVVSEEGGAAGPRLLIETAVHVVVPVALVRGHVPLEAGCARVLGPRPVGTLSTGGRRIPK